MRLSVQTSEATVCACRYGYPDASYLSRVRDELAAKGITSDSRQQPPSTPASSSLHPSSSSSSSSRATGPHVTSTFVSPQSVSSRAAGGGRGGRPPSTSRLYPDISDVAALSASSSSSTTASTSSYGVWSHPPAVATSTSASQRGSSTSNRSPYRTRHSHTSV